MKKWMTGGEGDNREWDGWMVSLTQWTWVWASSKSWWKTGQPAVHGVSELDTTEWLNNNKEKAGTSLMAQTVKDMPAMQETWVRSLNQEDPLGKGMANPFQWFSCLKNPWTEKPGRPQSKGLQRAGDDWAIHTYFFFFLEEAGSLAQWKLQLV